jgi:hypothetical protein
MQENLIPFVKMTLKVMLISLLLHAILIQYQIIFEGTKNANMDRQGVVHLLNLQEGGKL